MSAPRTQDARELDVSVGEALRKIAADTGFALKLATNRVELPHDVAPGQSVTFSFTVTAPAHWTVVSNAATPEPEELGDGKGRWRFPTTERMSTYITALIAGEYHEVQHTYAGKHGDIDAARTVDRVAYSCTAQPHVRSAGGRWQRPGLTTSRVAGPPSRGSSRW